MPAPIVVLAAVLVALSPADRREIRRFKKAGHADVAHAYRNASPEFRTAIPQAYQEADPEGVHPEWELELWRICHRESWCGKWGTPKIHPRDAWAGEGSYRKRVSKGHLDPENCAEHRIGEESGRTYAHFSTRGGYGQIAAGALRRLGDCVAPETLDDPYFGAKAVLSTFQACRKWDGEPGHRFQRLCTCREHTRLWMGAGNWARRTDVQRWRATTRQCGVQPLPGVWAWVAHGAVVTWRWGWKTAPKLFSRHS